MNNKIIIIKNPLNRAKREIIEIDFAGQSVFEMVKTNIPLDLAVTVAINGGLIPEEEWEETTIQPGDELIMMPVLHGDTSSILQVVALIALIAVAPAIAGGALGGWGIVGSEAFGIGVVFLAGGMLINSLFARPLPKLPDFGQTSELSQSFSFSPVTRQAQGSSIPVIYGRNKVFGNIIASHSETNEDTTKQILNMLIALGGGPIGGVVNDDPSDLLLGEIEINDQPISNYPDVTVEERTGLMNQSAISFFKETSTEVTPNRTVVFGTPIVHTTTAGADDLEVTLGFPQGISHLNDDESIGSHNIDIKIEISIASANNYSTLVEKTITDSRRNALRRIYKASKTYEGGSSFSIDSANSYDIKITKLSEDETGLRFGDKVILNTVKEILDDLFQYPKLALIGIKALASESISGSIKFSAIVDGKYIKDIRTGDWVLSSNPSLICYDILTQPVLEGDDPSNFTVNKYNGLLPENIDISAFSIWADYCDTLVRVDVDNPSDLEPFLQFDGVFDAESNVWDAALRVCQVSRAMLLWRGNTVSVVIDRATESSQMFNLGNVIKDSFKQTFMNQSERAREIEVSFIDKDQDYKKTTVNFFNPNIANTTKKVSQNMFGVNRSSQVWRDVQFQLNLNQLLRDTIQFSVDLKSLAVELGDVLEFVSPTNSDVSSGNITDISRDQLQLTLDTTPIQNNPSQDVYSVTLTLQDGTLETKTVTSVDDNIVTIDSIFSQTVLKDSSYTFGVTGSVTQLYRVLNIVPNGKNQAKLSCIQYSDDFYDDSLAVLQQDIYTPATAEELKVKNLTVKEEALITPEGIINRSAIVNWDVPTEVPYARAEVWWKVNSDGLTYWNHAGSTTGDTFTIPQLAENTEFIIRVVSVDINEITTSFEISPTVTFTTGSNSQFEGDDLFMTITGLRVSGTFSQSEFLGQEISVEWDKDPESDNPSSYPSDNPSVELFNDTPSYWIRDYEVTVLNFNNTIRRVVFVTDPNYTYSIQDNINDTISRDIRFSVKVRDKYLRVGSRAAVISLSNPAPDVTGSITATAINRGFTLNFLKSSQDLDFQDTKVFSSKNSGFTTATDEFLVGRTTDSNFSYFPEDNGSYFFKLTSTDLFFGDTAGDSGLSTSGEGSVVVADTATFDTDYPQVISITFTANDPDTDSVSWDAGAVAMGGTTIAISSSSTNKTWIYWNEGDAFFTKTDVQNDAIGITKWVMCINIDGEPTVPFATRIVDAGILQAGTITASNAILANASITSANIQDAAITSAKINDLAVVSAKIGNLEVKNAQIDNLSVGTTKIQDNATTLYQTAETVGESDFLPGFNDTPFVAQTITETNEGGLVELFFSVIIHNYDTSPHFVLIELFRDAVVILPQVSSGTIAAGSDLLWNYALVDAPGSGSTTYTMEMVDQNTGTPDDHKVNTRVIVYSESKGK